MKSMWERKLYYSAVMSWLLFHLLAGVKVKRQSFWQVRKASYLHTCNKSLASVNIRVSKIAKNIFSNKPKLSNALSTESKHFFCLITHFTGIPCRVPYEIDNDFSNAFDLANSVFYAIYNTVVHRAARCSKCHL